MNFVEKNIGIRKKGDSSFDGFLPCDRHKIIRKIGEGGVGAIFLAEDTAMDNRLVAIKSLPLIVAGNERSMKQLKKEAKLAHKLSHPNIVTLRSFETSNQWPYFVMDYIAGKTLEETLREKERLFEEEVLALFRPIADALDYAHAQGVIHRDIKPSNIMIREDGIPFIMNFGIARELKESLTLLTGKDTLRTMPYRSPEEIRGEMPSPAQDVYSLAVTMYECLTGKPPFCRSNIIHRILYEQVDGSHLPDELRESVIKGLSKSPDNRPKTCVDLIRGASTGDQWKDREEKGIKPSCSSETKDIDELVSKALKLGDQDRFYRELELLRELRDMYPLRTDISYAMLAVMEKLVERILAESEHASPSESIPEPPALSLSDKQTKVLNLGEDTKLELIYLQGGSFQTGSPSRFNIEALVNKEKLDGFWMGKFEVTQAQYRVIMGANPSSFKDDNRPVESVSWNEAMEFCWKLSQLTGKRFSLPTEAQWEYACRAGARTRYCFGDDEGLLNEYAWYGANSNNETHPVGQKKPNAWGLYDMHGNVYEWCLDCYDEGYDSRLPRHNLVSPDSGSYRVLRGGCWRSYAGDCRSAFRRWITQSSSGDLLGFRVVMTDSS